MSRSSYYEAQERVLEAKLRFLRAAEGCKPLGFVSRRPLVSIGGALLAGILVGRPFRSKRVPGAQAQAVRTSASLPLPQILSLVTTLVPLFFSRASSSGG